MKLFTNVKDFIHGLEDYCFPEYSCLLCGREVEDLNLHVCNDCKKEFKFISGNLCEKCGAHVNKYTTICDACKSVNFVFDASRSVFEYTNKTAKLVTGLKFKNKKYLAKYLARYMNEVYKEWGISADILVPVPISDNRLKERGFNQSELIAEELSILSNIPVNNMLVKRVKVTPNQKELTRAERMKNLIGAFKVVKTKDYENKVLLIIDDVFTTGATLNEVAKELLKLKPAKIYCLTAGKTYLHNNT